jgi:uncharacterized C2H2 Zn-finger protein
MVEYKCVKCDKIFKKLSHYKMHVNRKTSCDISNKEIEIEEIKNTEITETNSKNTIRCDYCNNKFTTKGSLKRHLTRCKIYKNNTEDYLVKITNEIKEQNDEFKKIIVNLLCTNANTNNTNNGTIINNTLNNNNNNNNIKIEFGKEDLSKISDKFFIRTLLNSSGAEIPCKIIEGIHFNPEFKENMSVYISDVSRNKAMIYDGKKWNIANAEEIVNKLFDKAIIFCEDKNEELYDKIQKNDKIRKKINKEMYLMGIMSNNEPHEYSKNMEPLDINGNILDIKEIKRGKCLNIVAKEHIKKSLYNKKDLIIKK